MNRREPESRGQFAYLMKREDPRMSGNPMRQIPRHSPITPSGSTNAFRHPATVIRAHREAKNGHGSAILWLAGLS